MIMILSQNEIIVATSETYSESVTHYTIENHNYCKNSFTIVHVDSVPNNAKYYWDGKFYKVSKLEYNEIMDELKNLDVYVPRVVEDIVEQSDFTIHQSKINIIERKKILRNKLIL